MKNVAIIGAGIVGITTAYEFAKQGYAVTCFEKESYPAMKCSYANGGQLSVSNSEVWNTWHNVFKGASWMFKSDAPLYISPSLEWNKIKWLSKFVRNTIKNVHDENTEKTIDLALKARTLYKKIIAEEDIKFDNTDCGILHVYKDYEHYKNSKKLGKLFEKHGVEWKAKTPLECNVIDFSLHNMKGLVGGIWTPSDSTGDIHKFCMHLYEILEQKYNVTFCFGLEISNRNILMRREFDVVVICNGVDSVHIARWCGDSLPIYPVKGYSITINLDAESKKHCPVTSILDDEAKIVTSTLGNRFRVAGTAELSGYNYDIRYDRVKPLLDWVNTNFPEIKTSDYSSWACLRPMTPDMLPIVKRSKKYENVFYNTGHGHLGWTVAPETARMVRELSEQ